MEMIEAPEFKLAWAKIVARASSDAAFRKRLTECPVAVFAEYGFTTCDNEQLSRYLRGNLQSALDAIGQQRAQQQAAQNIGAASSYYTSGCGGDPMSCNCQGTATQACRLPCWASQGAQAGQSSGGAPLGSAVNIGAAGPGVAAYCGCACQASRGTCWTFAIPMQSTQLSGGTAGGAAGGAWGAGTDMGARFNCLGSIGCAGCFGSVCGTAGSAGTVGCFGSAITSAQGGASAAGATIGDGATSGPAMLGAGFGALDSGARFNCWGTAGCIGSAGSFCGTAGTAGTGGTFGCGGGAMQSTQLSGGMGMGSDGLSSGATLGSFATYCGCIGGGGGNGGAPTTPCWGTRGCR